MAARGNNCKGAFTLVEVMLTISILAVSVIGTSGYRYYAALDGRKAEMQATAARVALLLCETWRGVRGDEDFDPVEAFGSELDIRSLGKSYPDLLESGFAPYLLGHYSVSVNNADYRLIMVSRNVEPGLKALNVRIWWDPRHQTSTIFNYFKPKSFRLTTFTTY